VGCYLEEIFNLLPKLLTPLIAVVALYIAYQQYQTNKLRENRESRQGQLSVYKRIKSFLNYVDTTREISESAYNELTDAISEADFLFDDETVDWMSDLQSYADEYRNCEDQLLSLRMRHHSPTAKIEKLRELEPAACAHIEGLQNKMVDDLQNAHCDLKKRFMKYLKI
jgi:hypothetical protein